MNFWLVGIWACFIAISFFELFFIFANNQDVLSKLSQKADRICVNTTQLFDESYNNTGYVLDDFSGFNCEKGEMFNKPVLVCKIGKLNQDKTITKYNQVFYIVEKEVCTTR